MNDEIILKRNCEAVLIPAGTKVTLQAGEPVIITQALGGSYTVIINGNMARIEARDADAIGQAPATAAPAQPEAPAATGGAVVGEEQILEQLRTCYDPEIPVNIVDLGLVYDLQIVPLPAGGSRVEIKMTLTAPGCGMGPVLQQDVETKVSAIPGVKEAAVFLVWDPPWNRDMLSEAAKLAIGIDVTTPHPVQAAVFDVESLRKDFPILDQQVHGHPLVYLDNAATSQKPRAVLDALSRFYENDNANVHRGIHELSRRSTEAYEGARDARGKVHQRPRVGGNYFHTRHDRGHQPRGPHLGREKSQGRRHHSAHGNGASQQHRPLAIAGRPHRREAGLRSRDGRRRPAGFEPTGRPARRQQRQTILPSPTFPTRWARSIPWRNCAPAPASATS